jgi:hypothetical protein
VSIGAEVKALVDPSAVTQTYRAGYVPDAAAFPYASFLDPVSDAIALQGDAQTLGRRRLVQVDLWQKEADFDPGLVEDVIQRLDGAKIPSAFRLSVTDSQALPEEDDVIHHAITVSMARLS